MKIVFTICSNNYLAQAKTLGESLLSHNPDYLFFICLCDKKDSTIDYSSFAPHTIIEVEQLEIPSFPAMRQRYNIIELNTSIKASIFKFFYGKYPSAEIVLYLDPDTYIFSSLISVEEELATCSTLLTPHILTPIEIDGLEPTEALFAQFGIYNLGFLGTRRSDETSLLLDWWERRLEINCYTNHKQGIFVDQLPMNYAPIFFEQVKISKNYGLNMAPWNLHERTLSVFNGEIIVNKAYPLVFYHFTKFNPMSPDFISKAYARTSLTDRPTLLKIHNDYALRLLTNDYRKLKNLPCGYQLKPVHKKTSISERILNKIKNVFLENTLRFVIF